MFIDANFPDTAVCCTILKFSLEETYIFAILSLDGNINTLRELFEICLFCCHCHSRKLGVYLMDCVQSCGVKDGLEETRYYAPPIST